MSHSGYRVFVRQEPIAARACGSADRPDRRPIDPIVILQLTHNEVSELFADGSTSSFFCVATLIENPIPQGQASDAATSPSPVASNLLTGTILSSIYHLRDPAKAGQMAAFFVFSNLNIRSEGTYSLRFDVFDIVDQRVSPVTHCISSSFTVYSAKRFPGMTNSTELSKTFSDQGLKIRIRKDIRVRKKSRLESSDAVSDSNENVAARPHQPLEGDHTTLPNALQRQPNNGYEGNSGYGVGHSGMSYPSASSQFDATTNLQYMRDQNYPVFSLSVAEQERHRSLRDPPLTATSDSSFSRLDHPLSLSRSLQNGPVLPQPQTDVGGSGMYCSERLSALPYELSSFSLFATNASATKSSAFDWKSPIGPEVDQKLPSFREVFPAYNNLGERQDPDPSRERLPPPPPPRPSR